MMNTRQKVSLGSESEPEVLDQPGDQGRATIPLP